MNASLNQNYTTEIYQWSDENIRIDNINYAH